MPYHDEEYPGQPLWQSVLLFCCKGMIEGIMVILFLWLLVQVLFTKQLEGMVSGVKSKTMLTRQHLHLKSYRSLWPFLLVHTGESSLCDEGLVLCKYQWSQSQYDASSTWLSQVKWVSSKVTVFLVQSLFVLPSHAHSSTKKLCPGAKRREFCNKMLWMSKIISCHD